MPACREDCPGFALKPRRQPCRKFCHAWTSLCSSASPLQGPCKRRSRSRSEAAVRGNFRRRRAAGVGRRKRGEQIYAYLGPAVRAFFRNGGRRCWVIRVAQKQPSNDQSLNYARYNYFPIPALARIEFDQNGNSTIRPAIARGRSEGSWSDRLQVSSALLSRPIKVESASIDAGQHVIHVLSDRSNELAAGDLLRLEFRRRSIRVRSDR